MIERHRSSVDRGRRMDDATRNEFSFTDKKKNKKRTGLREERAPRV